MKRFRFRLESLLDIKRRAEEEIKKELGAKNAEIASSQRDEQTFVNQLQVFYADEKEQRQRVLDLQALRTSISYRTHLPKDIFNTKQTILKLNQDLDAIRARLTKAKKQTRVLEMLREKRFAQWKKERARIEQKFTDDLSQTAYARQLRRNTVEKEAGMVAA